MTHDRARSAEFQRVTTYNDRLPIRRARSGTLLRKRRWRRLLSRILTFGWIGGWK